MTDHSGIHGIHYVPGMTEEQARKAARLDIPVLVAVLLTIPALCLHSADPTGVLGDISTAITWTLWLVFLAEIVVMLRLSPDDRAFVRHNKLDVALLVLTPPFLPGGLQVLWVLRCVRLIDVLPVMGRVLKVDGFRYAAMLAFISVFGGGLAFAELESAQDKVNGGFDGLWWAWVTITTTGYGDLYPESTAGRVLGMALMAVGPVLIGMIAGTATVTAERRIAAQVRGTAAELEVLEEEVDDVAGGVGELHREDERILAALEAIKERLDRLERAGPRPS